MGQGDITQALGHFLIAEVQEPVVQPVVRVANTVVTMRTNTLCHLVFMMGEQQVNATAVDVDR